MPLVTRNHPTMLLRRITMATIASLLGREACSAQSRPATIPTVVAEAMNLYFDAMLGPATYVVGKPPAGWPKDLIPARARIIGGGAVGNSEMFRIRTLVVELPVSVKPSVTMNALATSAGYATRAPGEAASPGGFINSPGSADNAPLCKGSNRVFGFRSVDSVALPRVIALHYLDGEGAKQNCDAAERSRMMSRGGIATHGPRGVPALVAPRGVMATTTGSNWSGSSGETRTMLRTTMAVDSILMHYTAQLVAAGWKTDGTLLANQSVGIQKFTFRDGEEAWSAALLIMSVGDRRDMGLRLSRGNSDY